MGVGGSLKKFPELVCAHYQGFFFPFTKHGNTSLMKIEKFSIEQRTQYIAQKVCINIRLRNAIEQKISISEDGFLYALRFASGSLANVAAPMTILISVQCAENAKHRFGPTNGHK